jgi:hypothetical protein
VLSVRGCGYRSRAGRHPSTGRLGTTSAPRPVPSVRSSCCRKHRRRPVRTHRDACGLPDAVCRTAGAMLLPAGVCRVQSRSV